MNNYLNRTLLLILFTFLINCNSETNKKNYANNEFDSEKQLYLLHVKEKINKIDEILDSLTKVDNSIGWKNYDLNKSIYSILEAQKSTLELYWKVIYLKPADQGWIHTKTQADKFLKIADRHIYTYDSLNLNHLLAKNKREILEFEKTMESATPVSDKVATFIISKKSIFKNGQDYLVLEYYFYNYFKMKPTFIKGSMTINNRLVALL